MVRRADRESMRGREGLLLSAVIRTRVMKEMKQLPMPIQKVTDDDEKLDDDDSAMSAGLRISDNGSWNISETSVIMADVDRQLLCVFVCLCVYHVV